MKCSSSLLFRGFLAVFGAALLLLAGGCESMRDPDGTDVPWTPTQDWERNPMLQNMAR